MKCKNNQEKNKIFPGLSRRGCAAAGGCGDDACRGNWEDGIILNGTNYEDL